MQPKFIACFIILYPDGGHGKSHTASFATLNEAQTAGEDALPGITAKLAPAQVIWMVREVAA